MEVEFVEVTERCNGLVEVAVEHKARETWFLVYVKVAYLCDLILPDGGLFADEQTYSLNG